MKNKSFPLRVCMFVERLFPLKPRACFFLAPSLSLPFPSPPPFKHWVSEDANSEFWFASVSKGVLVQKFSYENEFDLHENELVDMVDETHFHKNSFALRLVLTQRQTT